MSDSAKQLLRLRTYIDMVYRPGDQHHNADAWMWHCRLREQAAHIIGWMA